MEERQKGETRIKRLSLSFKINEFILQREKEMLEERQLNVSHSHEATQTSLCMYIQTSNHYYLLIS